MNNTLRWVALVGFLTTTSYVAIAWAGGRSASVMLNAAAPWGVPPTALTDGVPLTGMEYVMCSVHGVASTFTSGSVCWYYNPNEFTGDVGPFLGDAGWEHLGSSKQTASNLTDPDGGVLRRYAFPAKRVGLAHGRLICVGCPLSGTADDAGIAKFNVKTEAWGP